MRRADRICVLMSVSTPTRRTNPYVTQLGTALDAQGIRVRYFDWRFALSGAYDVLHVHWPELLIRGRGVRGRLRRLLFVALLARLRIRGTPIVWTVHNERPHRDGGWVERRLLTTFERRVRLRIFLHAGEDDDPDRIVIPHGHYIDWFAPTKPGSGEGPPEALIFGHLKRYKGIERAIEAFRGIESPDARLRVMGKPEDAAFAAELSSAVSGDARASLTLGFVSDEDLEDALRACRLVVLPYPKVYNSGAALLALSLQRPVLITASPSTRALAAEVGDRWVRLSEGDVDSTTLERAMRWARRRTDDRPPALEGRDWATAAALHAEAYRRSLERKT